MSGRHELEQSSQESSPQNRLEDFMEKLQNLSFWRRLFGWGSFLQKISKSYGDVKTDINNLENQVQSEKRTNDNLKKEVQRLQEEIKQSIADFSTKDTQLKQAESQSSDFKQRIITIEAQNISKTQQLAESKFAQKEKESELERLRLALNQKSKQVTELEKEKEERNENYRKNVEQLTQARQDIKEEKEQERQEKEAARQKKDQKKKETWLRHEESVKESLQSLCQRHQIEYLNPEKVPFKGNPDNTVHICEEYVIFDAKSPQNIEELDNFSSYIKRQAENAKKYIKEENVKKELFLVVPTNAMEVIKETFYHLSHYKVFVITIDALEPILLTLKRIEEYEFIEKLSPEERQNICDVIGTMAHGIKRRIQVDQFFAHTFIEILNKTETSLPESMSKEAIKVEQSAKLNPPMEKRSKRALTDELKKNTTSLDAKMDVHGVPTHHKIGETIDSVPLNINK